MRLHGDKTWTVCLQSAIKVKIQIQETVEKCKLSNVSSCQIRLLQNGNVTMFLRHGKVLNKSLLMRICERFFNAAPAKPSWKLSAFRLEIPASGRAEIAKQDHTLVGDSSEMMFKLSMVLCLNKCSKVHIIAIWPLADSVLGSWMTPTKYYMDVNHTPTHVCNIIYTYTQYFFIYIYICSLNIYV